jgi:hypothetical protein
VCGALRGRSAAVATTAATVTAATVTTATTAISTAEATAAATVTAVATATATIAAKSAAKSAATAALTALSRACATPSAWSVRGGRLVAKSATSPVAIVVAFVPAATTRRSTVIGIARSTIGIGRARQRKHIVPRIRQCILE